ncbi:hypothetical protein [Cryptosporangium arvum]|uniref:hypothetical protein n=1 Tax=Cryptosporangium arvum TaxID=80871 RepID=UPI0004B4D5F8|nr:hypothetical protein [Cryptosporangium arvum]
MDRSWDVGTLLIVAGALVLGLFLARIGCLRVVDPAWLPTAVLRRVDFLTRATPLIISACVVAILAGLILR